MKKNTAEILGQLIPIAGSWIENKFSKDGGEGNTQLGKLLRSLWRVGATIGLTLLVARYGSG